MYRSLTFEQEFDFEEIGEGRAAVKRFRPKHYPRSGWGETAVVRPGLDVISIDLDHPGGVKRRYPNKDVLKIHVRLEGSAYISGDHGKETDLSDGMLLMLVQPKDSEKLEFINAGRERSITLVCSREFLDDIAHQCNGALPRVVRNFLNSQSPEFATHMSAPTLQMRRAAEEMLDIAPRSSFRQMMYEAKALELLCAALEVDTTDDGPSLRHRDQSRVDELCAILQSDAGAKLTIGELCRAVHWNETQMMECFKQATGQTISNYRHKIIMDRAYSRLNNSEATIAHVAFDAGYDHPSNFATAFKRTFGISPREARRF
jgi:AraC-like DNA-binding protein